MVAIVILGLMMAATTPLLIISQKAAALTRDVTLAKNLASARMDEMRNLPFHIDASNGPFLDLLDEYFTSVSTSKTCVTPTGGVGVYVSGAGTSGEPTTGPFYKMTFNATPASPCTTGAASGYLQMPTRFSQEVDTQFLVPNRTGSVVTPPSNYNNDNPSSSQTDQPPSLLVGVTVLTRWTTGATAHTFRAYTEISDTGREEALVTVQAGATALEVSSALSDDSLINLVAGQIGGSGSLASESGTSDSGAGALLTQTVTGSAPTVVASTQSQAVAPPNPAGNTGQQSTGGITSAGYAPGADGFCGWGSVGPTQLNDVSGTVASAEPAFPSDAASGGTSSSAITADDSQGCAGVQFTNLYQDGTATPADTNPDLGLSPSYPIISVPDRTDGTVLSSSVSGNTPAQVFSGVQSPVASSATVTFNQEIDVFPELSFVDPQNGYEHHHALVYISDLQSSISCQSSSTGPSADSYSGTLGYWDATAGKYDTITLSLANTNLATQLSSALSTIVNLNGNVPLSAYISAWNAGNVVQEQPTGSTSSTQPSVNEIPAAFQLTTTPLLSSSYDSYQDSAVQLSVGRVSCSAQDNR